MFRTKYFCDACNDVFYRDTDHDPRKTKGRTPSCPICKKNRKVAEKDRMKIRGAFQSQTNEEIKQSNDNKIADIIASGSPPAMGNSTGFSQNYDAAMQMVAEDYKLSNLRDRPKVGENMVLPLSGKDESGTPLETRVDQVFTPQKNNVMGMVGNKLNSSIISQANAGAYKGYGDVIKRAQDSGIRPEIRIIGEYNEKPNANSK